MYINFLLCLGDLEVSAAAWDPTGTKLAISCIPGFIGSSPTFRCGSRLVYGMIRIIDAGSGSVIFDVPIACSIKHELKNALLAWNLSGTKLAYCANPSPSFGPNSRPRFKCVVGIVDTKSGAVEYEVLASMLCFPYHAHAGYVHKIGWY